MDLEQVKKTANELLQLLNEDLKGTQKYTLQMLMNNINTLIAMQEASIIQLTQRCEAAEKELVCTE